MLQRAPARQARRGMVDGHLLRSAHVTAVEPFPGRCAGDGPAHHGPRAVLVAATLAVAEHVVADAALVAPVAVRAVRPAVPAPLVTEGTAVAPAVGALRLAVDVVARLSAAQVHAVVDRAAHRRPTGRARGAVTAHRCVRRLRSQDVVEAADAYRRADHRGARQETATVQSPVEESGGGTD